MYRKAFYSAMATSFVSGLASRSISRELNCRALSRICRRFSAFKCRLFLATGHDHGRRFHLHKFIVRAFVHGC